MGEKNYREEREELLQQTCSQLENGHSFSPLELAAITPPILDSCHCPFGLAGSTYHLARDVAVKLALGYTSFMEALRKDASRYANTACMDDGSPYNPNPFDVLIGVIEKDPDAKKNPTLIDYLKGAFQHYGWVFSAESKVRLAEYFTPSPQPQRCS